MSWKPFFAVKINDKKLCARDLNNRIDTCQGDSGGPLVADKLSDDGKCKYLLSRPDQARPAGPLSLHSHCRPLLPAGSRLIWLPVRCSWFPWSLHADI